VKRFVISGFVLCSAIFVALATISCTTVDQIYRPNPYTAGPPCTDVFDLIDLEKKASRGDGPVSRAKIYRQRIRVPSARVSSTCGVRNSYSMSFIEFSETAEDLLNPEQFTDLKQHLAGKDVYLIVFVHGWRIDAGYNSSDLAKFHTYMNYARKYLNQRCIDRGRYCNTHLAGLFVSWRGRLYAEPHRGFEQLESERKKPFYHTLAAAPTVWNRKALSEKLADDVVAVLRDIQDDLQLDRPAGVGDRMLVMGHSLGGNLLATGLLKDAKDLVVGHNKGDVIEKLLGNLVLIINPAAEATKWTKIQSKLRKKAGVSIEKAVRNEGEPPPNSWTSMFPKNQRPVYIAMTSPCEWSPKEEIDDIKRTSAECDRATGWLFPIAHFWREKFGRTAVGHLLPDYSLESRIADGPPYGATHEFVVNDSPEIPTSISNSADPKYTACAVADHWLMDTRLEDGGWAHWDTYPSNLILSAPGDPRYEVQFRRGVSPATAKINAGEKSAVAPGNTPFWNVRAHYTSFKRHTGMLNHATWCAINQIVLDDIATDRK
jgi:hypothetical protein